MATVADRPTPFEKALLRNRGDRAHGGATLPMLAAAHDSPRYFAADFFASSPDPAKRSATAVKSNATTSATPTQNA